MTGLLTAFTVAALVVVLTISLWNLGPMLAVIVASAMVIGLSLIIVVMILHFFEEGEN